MCAAGGSASSSTSAPSATRSWRSAAPARRSSRRCRRPRGAPASASPPAWARSASGSTAGRSSARKLDRAAHQAAAGPLDVHAQPRKRLADQPRDLHLRDADPRRSRSASCPPRSAAAAPRSRALSTPKRRRAGPASRRGRLGSWSPSESASVTSSPVGSSSDRVRRARALDGGEDLLERGVDRVGQLLDGGRAPGSFVSLSRSLATWSWSSCRPRGTRTDHVLSRKWRLISPSTVGVAQDEKRTSRVTSKPSIAFMMPTQATWTRSSSGSPRPA